MESHGLTRDPTLQEEGLAEPDSQEQAAGTRRDKLLWMDKALLALAALAALAALGAAGWAAGAAAEGGGPGRAESTERQLPRAGALQLPLPPPPPPRCERSAERPRCPARNLFDDEDVHRKVVDNLMWVGHLHYGLEAREKATAIVKATLRKLSKLIGSESPALAEFLNKLQLDAAEKQVFLDALELAVDYKVQSVGRKVASAVHKSRPRGASGRMLERSEALMAGLENELELKEIRSTLDDVVRSPLRRLWGEGKTELLPTLALTAWEMALEPGVEPRPIKRDGDLHGDARNLAQLSPSERGESLSAAALLQGRALLNAMQMSMRLVYGDLAPVDGRADLFPASDVSCPVEEGSHGSAIEELSSSAPVCALTFGLLGADALRAVLVTDGMRADAPRPA